MKITGTQIIILFGVLVVGFFGLVGYQTYLENQPDIIPEEVIEAAVYEIFEQDSVITIPIEVEYQYTASDFISNGDTIGTVILLSKQSNIKMNEVEKKVAQSAATFLGSQMEI